MPSRVPLALFRLGLAGVIASGAAIDIPPASAAASGQTTTDGILPAAATAFATADTGWAPMPDAVAWVGTVGHDGPGALAVTSAGQWSAAGSPRFAVTPHVRYNATAWLRAANTGHLVGIGLRFYDQDGGLIASRDQVGQPVQDDASAWRRGNTVVGFAPTRAASAAVTIVTVDRTNGSVDYVDDVSVTQTTGTAAPLATPLSTSGPRVVDANGAPVTLHGVQLGGLSSRGWSDTSVTPDQVAAAQMWGANFVRLALGENPMIPGDCSYSPAYAPLVDSIVDAATSRGMLILLDLHTNAVLPCGPYVKQRLPDVKAVRFWQIVADRYKDNPLVAFDLYNEPHDVTDDVWRDGGRVTSGGARYDAVGMQTLYDTVRATGADNLVIASGNGWANWYPAKAPLTGTVNVVWGVHAYTCPSTTPAKGGKCFPGPAGLNDPSAILDNFADVGKTQPVMVTEFGYPDPNNGYYVANTDAFVTGHDWVGWSAFVFIGAGDFALLKKNAVSDPAASGMAVMTGMLGG